MSKYPCKIRCWAWLGALLMVGPLALDANADDQSSRALARLVAESVQTQGVAPLLSTRVANFDLARAYAVQAELVRAWPVTDPVMGFKSGFNSIQAQQRFGVKAPVFAVFPASALICHDKTTPCRVDLARYARPVFEIEVALRIGRKVEKAPQTREELMAILDAVLPAVELPELGMAAEGEPAGPDYVASNVGIRRVILGSPVGLELLQGDLPMVLKDASGTLVQGDGGGAIDSALFLLRQLIENGYILQPGQIVLTGAIGGMSPAKVGEIVADCGKLGSIEFSAQQ